MASGYRKRPPERFHEPQYACMVALCQGGVEAHGRCWYLGAEGATCGRTCGAQDRHT